MASCLTIHIDSTQGAIAETVTMTYPGFSGKRFIALRCDNGDISIILPGHDRDAVAAARAIADALLKAATALELELTPFTSGSNQAGDQPLVQEKDIPF